MKRIILLSFAVAFILLFSGLGARSASAATVCYPSGGHVYCKDTSPPYCTTVDGQVVYCGQARTASHAVAISAPATLSGPPPGAIWTCATFGGHTYCKTLSGPVPCSSIDGVITCYR